ncbi:MAG: phospholipase D-like domain-containing protein [Gammaproteobacteria bacterium]
MPDNHPPTPKRFLTNQGENTLSKRLTKILPLTQNFDCLVGYFFISGFFRLYPALETVKKVRILIGLKNEQVVHGLIQIANDGSDESTPSTAEIKATFGGMMRNELVQADDTLAIETGVRKFCEWIRSGKLEVKLYREQNIHAKVYIMTPEHPVESVNHGYVITGSSNLSHSGLEGNLEFNVLLAEPEEHDYALHRFNELWEHAVDVKDVHETILDTVEKESPFAFFTPYELYLKFLAEYFRDYLGDRSKLNTENLPRNFKKLSYQEDAVFTAQQMLKTYGGVFIADVVGLGKTYISALLALQLDGRCLYHRAAEPPP